MEVRMVRRVRVVVVTLWTVSGVYISIITGGLCGGGLWDQYPRGVLECPQSSLADKSNWWLLGGDSRALTSSPPVQVVGTDGPGRHCQYLT